MNITPITMHLDRNATLEAMENRTDIEGDDEILAAFCQFRQRMVDDGYFKPQLLHVA